MSVSDPARTVTVLLVDDDESTLKLLTMLLEKKGYRVVAARNSEEALRFWGYQQIDLLVTDAVMPKVNGMQLGHILRKSAPDLPILYISGLLSERVLPANPQREAFLLKPLSVDQLESTIKQLLSSRPSTPAQDDGNGGL